MNNKLLIMKALLLLVLVPGTVFGTASDAYCEKKTYASACNASDVYCEKNPYASSCSSEGYCKQNPQNPSCKDEVRW